MQECNPTSADTTAETALRNIKPVMQKEEEKYPRNAWRELLATPPNQRRLLILVTLGLGSTLAFFGLPCIVVFV